MRVLKRSQKKMTVTCAICGATLELKIKDIRHFSAAFPEYPEAFFYKCPCCKGQNSMTFEDLPEGIRIHYSNLEQLNSLLD